MKATLPVMVAMIIMVSSVGASMAAAEYMPGRVTDDGLIYTMIADNSSGPEEPATSPGYEGGTMESPITYEEARAIALNSTCVQEGSLTDVYAYNEYTGTWWIEMEPVPDKPNCNPACVVDVQTLEAEINWRCTGAIPPEGHPEDIMPITENPEGTIGIWDGTGQNAQMDPISSLFTTVLGFFLMIFGGV
ncbi:MAG: hypothetical protein DRO99_02785 [Candidatus Aenigmatarchaeota archaeon]|nr:MAG: hypothetical protein DRO99_02785 [Candidatus Aenigmarchaeota archaeon]